MTTPTHLTEEELTPAPKMTALEIFRNYETIGYQNAILDVMKTLKLTEEQLLILHTLKPKP